MEVLNMPRIARAPSVCEILRIRLVKLLASKKVRTGKDDGQRPLQKTPACEWMDVEFLPNGRSRRSANAEYCDDKRPPCTQATQGQRLRGILFVCAEIISSQPLSLWNES